MHLLCCCLVVICRIEFKDKPSITRSTNMKWWRGYVVTGLSFLDLGGRKLLPRTAATIRNSRSNTSALYSINCLYNEILALANMYMLAGHHFTGSDSKVLPYERRDQVKPRIRHQLWHASCHRHRTNRHRSEGRRSQRVHASQQRIFSQWEHAFCRHRQTSPHRFE